MSGPDIGGRTVFVAVGTDHHPFDRLVGWADRLSARDRSVTWFVQSGTTPVPEGLAHAAMLGLDDLLVRLAGADAVVTHGGPGLILEAREHGHVPIVVPRDPSRGEHVDNHQELFTARLAGEGTIRRVTTFEEFDEAVQEALAQGKRGEVAGDAVAPPAVDRFARLVDELVGQRRRPR